MLDRVQKSQRSSAEIPKRVMLVLSLLQYELRKALVQKLVATLNVKVSSEITPAYMSNITAFQLLNNGLTLIAVGRAIAILDALHFDTSIIQDQLSFLNKC